MITDDEVTPVSSIRLWIAHDVDKAAEDVLKYYDGVEKGRWYRELKRVAADLRGELGCDVV